MLSHHCGFSYTWAQSSRAKWLWPETSEAEATNQSFLIRLSSSDLGVFWMSDSWVSDGKFYANLKKFSLEHLYSKASWIRNPEPVLVCIKLSRQFVSYLVQLLRYMSKSIWKPNLYYTSYTQHSSNSGHVVRYSTSRTQIWYLLSHTILGNFLCFLMGDYALVWFSLNVINTMTRKVT